MNFRRLANVRSAASMVIAALLLSVGACNTLKTKTPPVVPLYGASEPGVVPGRFFVILPDDAPDSLLARTGQNILEQGGTIHYTYTTAPKGFSATLPPQALESVLRDPNIRYLEAVQEMRAAGLQSCAPWPLDNLDVPSDGVYAYAHTGKNALIYVVDTGVQGNHPELKGRVYIDPQKNAGADADCSGHGTAVASAAAGATVGIAKSATIVPLQLPVDCQNPCDTLILEDAVKDTIAKIKPLHGAYKMANPAPSQTAVVLLSWTIEGTAVTLGGEIDALGNDFLVVVPAGNINGKDACEVAPANYEHKDPSKDRPILVAGSTNDQFVRSDFSNIGPCVSLFAPGEHVITAAPSQPDICSPVPSSKSLKINPLYARASGTSMSVGYVGGLGAIIAAELGDGSDAFDVEGELLSRAAPGMLQNKGVGSPDLVLHNAIKAQVATEKTSVKDEDVCSDGLEGCEGDACEFLCDASIGPDTYEPGQRCCDGLDLCGEGVSCGEKGCERCGSAGRACCKGECAPGLDCSDENTCVCGKSGFPCCDGVQCEDGLACGADLKCGTCGGVPGEPCCDGDCPTLGLVCSAATQLCVACGHENQPCCDFNECVNGLACDVVGGQAMCVACGEAGQPCCNGVDCGSGYTCDTSGSVSMCIGCGALGEACCDGANCGNGLACNVNKSLPSCEACGGIGQPCCGASCGDGTCYQGICEEITEVPLGDLVCYPLQLAGDDGWFDNEFDGDLPVEVTVELFKSVPNCSNCIRVTADIKMTESDLVDDSPTIGVAHCETTIELPYAPPFEVMVDDTYFWLNYVDPANDRDWDDAILMAGPNINPSDFVVSVQCVAHSEDDIVSDGNDICNDAAPPSAECSSCVIHMGSIKVKKN